MNLGKAKDYFSAYYEGSLDRGLRQSFEARLNEDAQLQAEYRAFERTMKDLESFGQVQIEPPADLHEKIAARLDRALWEQKQTQKTPVLNIAWWKGLIVGGVAVAGIAVVFVASGTRSNPSTSNAGAIPIPALGSNDQPKFEGVARGLTLSYPASNHRIVIRSAEGTEQRLDLNGQSISNKLLSNNTDKAVLISLELEDVKSAPIYIALPGKTRESNISGKGTLKELALAIAGRYSTPVVVESKDTVEKTVSWNLTASDVLSAASGSVSEIGYSVDQRSGYLKIASQ